MEHRLEADHVSKVIRKKALLKDVSLSLQGGKIYGFVGENGSGKTMLFRTLSGLIKPTEGTVRLDGMDIHKGQGKANIGVIIENSAMWPDMTGLENLLYLSQLRHKISKEEVRAQMERVGLDPANKLSVRKYSLGMKQRLIVAQAVMEQPDFLFLDEPTNAIDKEGVVLIRRIIEEEAARGAVVLMASHVSQDISDLCAETFQMEEGRLSRMGGKQNEAKKEDGSDIDEETAR